MFLGHRGWLRCRIHVSPVEAVSLMIYESLGAVCGVESMRHPSKQFRWWFLRPHRLFALSNPRVACGSIFVDYFWVESDSVFVDVLSPQRLIALSNPRVTRGSSYVDYFWGHRGCSRCRIHVSPVKGFFFMISELTMTQFLLMFLGHRGWLRCRIHASHVEAVSLMISESTVVACVVETMSHPWKQFC